MPGKLSSPLLGGLAMSSVGQEGGEGPRHTLVANARTVHPIWGKSGSICQDVYLPPLSAGDKETLSAERETGRHGRKPDTRLPRRQEEGRAAKSLGKTQGRWAGAPESSTPELNL